MELSQYIEKDASDQQYDSESQKLVKSKNPRRRKRAFYNSIRKQMEFYFGNANLSKDRFLMQLIKEDPFVPLDVFLKFNKIKKLCGSTEEIANAVSYSELLKLNEDRTKVRRVTEIPETWDADNRTIYVESLPPIADHDWVRNVFSRFGVVAYVSLPRFKISRKIKEFAFVEFESPESVKKAVTIFKALGNVISVDSDPEKLASISSYAKEQEEEIEEVDGTADNGIKTEKRPRSPESSGEGSDAKRQKTSPAVVEEVESDQSESGGETDISSMEPNAAGTDGESDVQVKRKKKRRRRHKKGQKKAGSSLVLSELKILPKVEWKQLRNKYLNMQRKMMGEIKRAHLRKKQSRPAKQTKVEVVKKPQSMNFYGAGQENTDTSECNPSADNDLPGPGSGSTGDRNPALERKPLFTYESDLIVHIKLLEAVTNVKSFKMDMKQYPGVKYVDVKEGSLEAFIRCETPKHAKNLKKRVACAQYTCKILSGDAEVEYWNKIMRDREMKLNKEVKVPHKRGREKLFKAAATHIFFKDEE